jgi:myo-inositol-1-phosphate synthase
MSSSSLFTVNSPNVTYKDDEIVAQYLYRTSKVDMKSRQIIPIEEDFTFKTQVKVPKVGVMLVGLGGNNGTTVVAGILANKLCLQWHTKDGEHKPNYYGSVTQASTVRVGYESKTANRKPVYLPFNQLLPMVNPNDLMIAGWDISALNLGE